MYVVHASTNDLHNFFGARALSTPVIVAERARARARSFCPRGVLFFPIIRFVLFPGAHQTKTGFIIIRAFIHNFF